MSKRSNAKKKASAPRRETMPPATAKALPKLAPKAEPKVKFCKTLDCSKPAEVRGHCRLHFLHVLRGKAEGSGQPEGKLSLVGDRRRNSRLEGPDEDRRPDDQSAAERVEALQSETEDLVGDAEELLRGYGYDDTGT